MCKHISIVIIMVLGLFGNSHAKASEYSDGQAWRITKGQYKNAQVIIVKVENHPIQKHVIHISVVGPVTSKSGQSLDLLPHFPFTKEGLDKSKLKLTGRANNIPPDWRKGYEYWNEEAMQGNAGAFTIPVSDAIDIIFVQMAELPDSKTMDPNDLGINDYVHETLPSSLLKRIEATTDVFESIDGVSFEQAVDLYRRDYDPESNLVIWEEMARVFTSFCDVSCDAQDKKKEVYTALLLASMFPKEEIFSHLNPKILTPKEVDELADQYSLEPQPIPVVKQ